MEVHYCDLCPNVLKKERHIVVIIHDQEFSRGKQQYRQQQPQASYEICDSCYQLIMKIFSHKTYKIDEIKKWINKTYELPKEEQNKDGE